MTAPKKAADKPKRVGFLATGSEIVSGEILNTNSQTMAQVMLEHGISLGEHVIVDDGQDNISEAFRFLLSRHDAIISTGGLGPTSDDLTRNAIADVLGLKLIFNPTSYQKIVDRITHRYGQIAIPETNKRQAYFPEGSLIIPNPNGTADACQINFQNKLIYLLPGPPSECLPIFSEKVLPHLCEQSFNSESRLYRWTVQGIPEAKIAELLEEALKEFNLIFGYRARSPYIDIKLNLSPSPELKIILGKVEAIVGPYLVL